MSTPTISRYAASIAEPYGLFKTLGEPLCEKTPHGELVFFAGGNSAVFKVRIGNTTYALKCYTKEHPRTAMICDMVTASGSSLFIPARYMPDELYVYEDDGTGSWCDIVLTEWIEGVTLNEAVIKALHDRDTDRLKKLAGAFDAAAIEMLQAEWGHGDIKPENIIVTPDGRIRLTDTDAMYFPALSDEQAIETGTPLYQHPLRNEQMYDRHIDDFPLALISATLHSLTLNPELYRTFGNADYFLFDPVEVVSGDSCGYTHIKELAASSGDAVLYALLLKLSSPAPHIKGLAEIINAFYNTPSSDPEVLSAFPDGGRWGYMDMIKEQMVIPPIFDSALEYSEGLALVEIGGYRHFVDASGRLAINCSEYEAVKPFRAGQAAVKKEGRWSYVDKSGIVTLKD